MNIFAPHLFYVKSFCFNVEKMFENVHGFEKKNKIICITQKHTLINNLKVTNSGNFTNIAIQLYFLEKITLIIIIYISFLYYLSFLYIFIMIFFLKREEFDNSRVVTVKK